MSYIKRAAIYARVSSERQAAEDRVSIEVQIADCEAYCRERGYHIVARYIDREKYRAKGKLVQPSGQRKDRPQYLAMLKAVKAGDFDVIIAWKEDRLYRGMYAAMPFSEVLDELGKKFDVELVKETFDRKMLGIKAALGKIEVDNIRERMLMGRRARLEKGEVPGGNQVKYGYKKVDRHLEIEEKEVEVIRKIFSWYIAGQNNMQIRRKLNALNTPTRSGNLWAKVTIENILTTEAYVSGQFVTNLDGETFTISCPPIISMTVWKKAQEVRRKNTFKARNVKRDFLCVDLVYCICGWKCRTRTSYLNLRRGYNSVTGTYYCQRYSINPESMPHGCVSDIGSKKVDTFVWNFIRKICDNPIILKEGINRKLATLNSEAEETESEAGHLQKQIDNLVIERQNVITMARKNIITEKDLELQLAALRLQEIEIQKELDQQQANLTARQQAKNLSNWADQYLSEIWGGIESFDVNPETLTSEKRQKLFKELEAWRFDEKFPSDEMAQLKWAILEEKRRTVKMLISRVIIEKVDGPEKRKITPILSIEIPIKSSTSGDQSLEYIEQAGQLKALKG